MANAFWAGVWETVEGIGGAVERGVGTLQTVQDKLDGVQEETKEVVEAPSLWSKPKVVFQEFFDNPDIQLAGGLGLAALLIIVFLLFTKK